MSEQSQAMISFIGIMLQLAGAMLLSGLFVLLRRYTRRRRYFAIWSWAWLALVAAIGVVALIYALPGPLIAALPVTFTYQFAKLGYFALLVAGTAMYARGSQITPFLPVSLALAAAYSLVSVYATEDWQGVVAWQAPVAVLALGWCGAQMFTMPPSRRAVGSRLAGFAFMAMAATWALYFPAFAGVTGSEGELGIGILAVMVRFNTYIDVLLLMILGCGMIVILMEDAKRDVDDAHAELAVAHSELRRSALYDPVTGTLNRRAFTEGVGLEMARAKFGAVMMVDLDDLKSVNDMYGHTAGDALLRHLAEAVRMELRPSDKLYRWGGDEFLLVLPAADATRADARLRGVVARAASLKLGDDDVRLSVSIGSAAYQSAEEIPGAIDRADALMYDEKSRKKFDRQTAVKPAE